ncbi:hypothetical protein DENSPDRAFT_704960 [Dentipellis sp. KUC8613]|nr:hypothetical protein DENSPDRAFT_704960 [Dentipellis sp. KUC8613]
MCTLLWRMPIRATGTKFNNTIRSLLLYSSNTGILTALVASMCLMTYALRPDAQIFIPLMSVLTEVYRIAFMGSLNWRNTLKQQQDADLNNPTVLSAIAFSTSPIRASFVPCPDYPAPATLTDPKVVLDISKRFSEHLNMSESQGHGAWIPHSP